MEEMYLERESDAPEGWEENVILRRNADGQVEEVNVPDDPPDELLEVMGISSSLL